MIKPHLPLLAIFPFYPRGDEERSSRLLQKAVESARTLGAFVVIVEDGVRILPTSNAYVRLTMPTNRGKIAATRDGLAYALRFTDPEFVAVCDWDDEQDVSSLVDLTDLSATADVVIGDRYGKYSQSEMPEHRVAVNHIQRLLCQNLGFDASDLVSGLIGCNRDFAQVFVESSRCDRFAVGFEWMLLAFLNGKRIRQVPITAKMRSDKTEGGKLADTFAIILRYTDELRAKDKGHVVEFAKEFATSLRRHVDPFSVPVHLLGDDRLCIGKRSNSSYSFHLY